MFRKKRFIFVTLILLVLFSSNLFVYLGKKRASISGFAISEISSDMLNNIMKFDIPSIIFVAEIFLIFLIIFIFLIKILMKLRAKAKVSNIVKPLAVKEERGLKTDLDSLYSLLKDKKSIKISAIAKTFKINENKAFEWCQILENYGLVNIKYSTLSEPEVEVK